MIVSEARRQANRTQPIDDLQEFRARASDWRAALNPVGPTQEWFADEVARITIQLDHAGQVDRNLRDQSAMRAETCWDLDRRLEAETLARSLSKRPGETAIALRRTVHGCDLLIQRWAMLAHVADQNGKWDEPQIAMAFDLLGTPPEVRGADPCFQLDEEGRVVTHPAGPAGFARAQLESLRATRATLKPLDDFDRESATHDLTDPSTPEYRRFRRHESALQARLKWCMSQIKSDTPAPPRPKPIAPPPPVVVAPPAIEDDLEGVPTDEEIVAWFRAEATKAGFDDIDALLPSRADRDQLRAAARRDAENEGLAGRRS